MMVDPLVFIEGGLEGGKGEFLSMVGGYGGGGSHLGMEGTGISERKEMVIKGSE